MDEAVLKLLKLLDTILGEKGTSKLKRDRDANVIASPNSPNDNDGDKKKGLTADNKSTLVDVFSLFNKMFFEYQKKMTPDTKLKTLSSNIAAKQVAQRQIFSPEKKEAPKFNMGSILSGLLLIGAGLAAAIAGIMSDGPFKGALKILAEIGLKIGGKLLSPITKFLGKFVSKITGFLFGGLAKIGGKVFGKLGGGGLMKMAMKFLKPLAKVFKRIPVIGTILSIAFAYSRFKSGDVVGGVIDVLSGLAGLVDLVLPGVGTAMSIGLDVLNAVLDAKADQGEGKPKKNKMTILKDMASSVGSWIWSKRMYIPILSSVNRFMMAWDDFKAGNISSGLGNFGIALSSLLTGVDSKVLLDGISGFMGLFEGSGGTVSEPKPNKSFISEMGDVLGENIKKLWEWIKQKLKEGIAGMIPGGKAVMDFASNAATSTKELTAEIITKHKENYQKAKSFIGDLWNKAVPPEPPINETVKDVVKAVKPITPDIKNDTQSSDFISALREKHIKSSERIRASLDAEKKIKPLRLLPDGTIVVNSDYKKPEEKLKVERPVIPNHNVALTTLAKGGNSGDGVKMLYKLNFEANQYLKNIATNIALLVRNNGNSAAPPIIMTSNPTPPKSEKQMVPLGDNRGGYASSPYSLA